MIPTNNVSNSAVHKKSKFQLNQENGWNGHFEMLRQKTRMLWKYSRTYKVNFFNIRIKFILNTKTKNISLQRHPTINIKAQSAILKLNIVASINDRTYVRVHDDRMTMTISARSLDSFLSWSRSLHEQILLNKYLF